MTDELLHLNAHETVRLVSDTPEELEVEATWGPGGSPPPAHVHRSQDEQFEVRSGRLTAMVAGEERSLGPGDTLEIPRGTPHNMWNSGTETASAAGRTRPAGGTADWFRPGDRLSDGGTRKPPLPAMANALTSHSDVFQLAVGPRQLWPLVRVALRRVALADRRGR